MTRLGKTILSKVGIVAILGILSITGLAAGCASPTAIEIASPQDGSTVGESPLTVTGTVSGYPRGGEVAIGEQTARIAPEVTVNGTTAEVAQDGSFSAQVELTEGENTIEAVALLNDVEARDSITVTYAPVAPALSVEITSPEDGAELTETPVTVTGTVSNAEAVVTVNSVVIAIAADGSFSAQVELIDGQNTITAAATLGELHAQDTVTVTYSSSPAVVPLVEITSPEDAAELAESQVTIAGTVSPPGATAAVNGVVVAHDGTFAAQVVLTEGENTITVAAALGRLRAEDSITVTYVPVAPALSVEITSPEDGAELTETPVTVTGTVSDAEATFTINDQAVEVATDGAFSAQIELAEGENTIEAVALLNDVEVRDSITVTYVPVAPALSVEITSPEDGAELTETPVTVTGTVSDAEATLTINDQAVEVATDGAFSAQVELAEGENVIEVVATLGDEEVRANVAVLFAPEAAL